MKTRRVCRSVVVTFAILGLVAVGSSASARTDVKAKQQQLAENLSASKTNLLQYEANLKTVLSNISEAEKALKLLERQRQAVAKQGMQSGKDQQTVESIKAEVTGLIRAERDKASAEDRQIEDLKQALARLEENKVKRAANIAAYEDRLSKVESDQAGAGERGQSITDLEQGLKLKEEEARVEKKKLMAKKAEYEEEITKWKKQIRVSERAASNFSKVKEQ